MLCVCWIEGGTPPGILWVHVHGWRVGTACALGILCTLGRVQLGAFAPKIASVIHTYVVLIKIAEEGTLYSVLWF